MIWYLGIGFLVLFFFILILVVCDMGGFGVFKDSFFVFDVDMCVEVVDFLLVGYCLMEVCEYELVLKFYICVVGQ